MSQKDPDISNLSKKLPSTNISINFPQESSNNTISCKIYFKSLYKFLLLSSMIGNIAFGIYSITNSIYITKYEYIFIPLCISLCLSVISIYIPFLVFCNNTIKLFTLTLSYFIILGNIVLNIYIIGMYYSNKFFIHSLSFIYICISFGLHTVLIFNIIYFNQNETSNYSNNTNKYPEAIADYKPLKGNKIKTTRNVTI